MSLFKAREWWSAQCGSGEEFDGNSLCVANVDNDPDEGVKVITGSLKGMLRIYQPRQGEYRPEDLLYEQELEQAILQLAVGRFSSAGGLQLAVLHPRKLVVMSVQSVGAQYLQVTPLYEHLMEHTAANMCYGAFGGVKGCDHICVQSYDGQLSFYECELFAFARYLPAFLIPGPVAYVESADLVVTSTAGLELEAYKYRSLAAASGDKQEAPGAAAPQVAGMSAGKRLAAEWRAVLGEAAVDIRAGQLSAGLTAHQSDIIVLCEHHVYVVSSAGGQVVFQKRLEYHPAAACLAPAPDAKLQGGLHNLVVATFNKSLAVYRSNVLVWAARLDHQPVALALATLGQPPLAGLLVSLDQDGQLRISYMGTDPITNPVDGLEGTQLDYEAMGREQKALAAVIREHASGRRVPPPDKLTLRPLVPSMLDHVRAHMTSGGDAELQDQAMAGSGRLSTTPRISARLLVTYQGPAKSADNVYVHLQLPYPLRAPQDSWQLSQVTGDESSPVVLTFTLLAASPPQLPTSATATITASFTAQGGEPRAYSVPLPLPMCLFASLVAPVKDAVFKLTVSTNKAPPVISELFPDMTAHAPSSIMQIYTATGANVLSFAVHGSSEVTVVVSKNAGRYRLQSDNLEAMWLVLGELVQRLEVYFSGDVSGGSSEGGGGLPPDGPLLWSMDDPLPLLDVMEVVDAHFACRQRCRQLKATLETHAQGLRAIQKRLLIRFKDKSPAPLCNLDVLLEQTYAALQETTTQLEQEQGRLKGISVKLSGAVNLLIILTRLKFGLSSEEVQVLRSSLVPDVVALEEHSGDIGWEEVVEAALTQLLRSCLARNSKEAAVTVPALAPSTDVSKIKKMLALVLERLAKGQRIVEDSQLQSHGSLARQPSKK